MLLKTAPPHEIDQPVHAPLQLAHGEARIIRRPATQREGHGSLNLVVKYDRQGDPGLAHRLAARSAWRHAGDSPLFAHGDLGDLHQSLRAADSLVRPMRHRLEAVGLCACKHHDRVACALDELTLEGQPRLRHVARFARLQKPFPESGLEKGDRWRVISGICGSRTLVDHHGSCVRRRCYRSTTRAPWRASYSCKTPPNTAHRRLAAKGVRTMRLERSTTT